MRLAVFLSFSILSLTGCGSSGDAGKVVVIARSESHAEGGKCDKVRDDAVGGRLVGLYSCELTGVPPAYRLAGSFDNPTQRYCFGFVNDAGVDMTERFGSNCRRSGAPQNEAVVHVYFCTSDTCAREATKTQMDEARTALGSALVEKVVFVSKEESLRIMKEKHPKEVEALPRNPFPNSLTVIPKHPEDVGKVAALFQDGPSLGIDKVDYGR